MRLEVPFYKQTTDLNCGPTALKMVLSFFGENLDIGLIEEKVGIEEGKIVSTIQLAIASSKLGFKTDFFSKHLLFNEEHKNIDFYKKYSLMNLELSKKLVEKAKASGVTVQEKTLSVGDLVSYISRDSLPILLLDWNVVKGNKEKGYLGHFIPIVGYDKNNILVHNQGFENPAPFVPIKTSIFDEARKARGTDEDVVIVYRKNKKK